jgi:hypothetical protein
MAFADPLRVLRTWGVGLLIPSSENSVNAKFAEFAFWHLGGAKSLGCMRRQGNAHSTREDCPALEPSATQRSRIAITSTHTSTTARKR